VLLPIRYTVDTRYPEFGSCNLLHMREKSVKSCSDGDMLEARVPGQPEGGKRVLQDVLRIHLLSTNEEKNDSTGMG
jgi:hypothetical protein